MPFPGCLDLHPHDFHLDGPALTVTIFGSEDLHCWLYRYPVSSGNTTIPALDPESCADQAQPVPALREGWQPAAAVFSRPQGTMSSIQKATQLPEPL